MSFHLRLNIFYQDNQPNQFALFRVGTRDSWGEAMQALSHFSYHKSGGQFLLCDLQGGSYRNG